MILCPQYVRAGPNHNMHTYSKPSINLCPPDTEDASNIITHLKNTRTSILLIVSAIHTVSLRNPIHLSVRRNPLVRPNTDT